VIRVVYVMHGDGGDLAPQDVLDRWPTTARTLQALARTGNVEVIAIVRTRTAAGNECFEQAGVRYRFVRDRTRGAIHLARAARAERPDVLHVNGLLFALATIVLRVWCGRRPRLLVQHHGEPPGRGRARRLQMLARRLVDGYLFTGAEHGQAEPFVAAGILRHNTPVFEVLESAADLHPVPRADARARTGVAGDPAVVWVGRMNEGKDPMAAVQGFAQFLASRPETQLWMIASTRELEPAVRHELGLDERLATAVHIVGPVPHAAMADWLSAGDVVLSTSRHEGSGYALVEAITCGCSPVATDIPPHRAIVDSTAPLVPVGDPAAVSDALATATRAIAADPGRRRATIDDARLRLGWDAVARQLLSAYGAGTNQQATTLGP
jgi:glycosyltransferase involved in cell wall biosynthesis